jgi:hypothetical protein
VILWLPKRMWGCHGAEGKIVGTQAQTKASTRCHHSCLISSFVLQMKMCVCSSAPCPERQSAAVWAGSPSLSPWAATVSSFSLPHPTVCVRCGGQVGSQSPASVKNHSPGWMQWCAPLGAASGEAERGGLLSSRPAWAA